MSGCRLGGLEPSASFLPARLQPVLRVGAFLAAIHTFAVSSTSQISPRMPQAPATLQTITTNFGVAPPYVWTTSWYGTAVRLLAAGRRYSSSHSVLLAEAVPAGSEHVDLPNVAAV